MNALTKAFDSQRSLIATVRDDAVRLKASGVLSGQVGSSMLGEMGSMMQNQAKYQSKYALFRGWIYSAVHAIADAAAGQPVSLARLKKVPKNGDVPKRSKAYQLNKMPNSIRAKAIQHEMDMLEDHPLVATLESPNPFQDRCHFTYTFVANLALTGWAYVVRDKTKDGKHQFICLPTTWITPKHEKGPFSKFVVRNPQNPNVKGEELDRSQVAFAHLPNPSDPLSAMSPAGAQITSIRIDDHIQTCQEQFFYNGVFPSVIITMGKNPDPDMPGGGNRPMLTPAQRRQVNAVIRKTWAGVHNYGNPAIIDASIERIERLGATQNEIGWEKSEMTVRTRILSSYGVHPFILGETMPGSYAQASIVEGRFYRRVNGYLEMLSNLMTNFIRQIEDEDSEDLLAWWEKLESRDQGLYYQNMREARKTGDITKNEYRAILGFPPAEDEEEEEAAPIGQSLFGGIIQLIAQIGQGNIDPTQGEALLVGLGVPKKVAEKVSGIGIKREQQVQQEQEVVEDAVEELKRALVELKVSPSELANRIERECLVG